MKKPALGLVLLVLLALSATAQYRPPLHNYASSSPPGHRVWSLGGSDGTIHQGRDLIPIPDYWTGRVDWNVYAIADGIVETHFPPPGRGWKGHPIFGSLIVILHANGDRSVYGHMSSTKVSERGPLSRIRAGQMIGVVGSTGISSGPHLHFGIIVDPLAYIGRMNDHLYWIRMNAKGL